MFPTWRFRCETIARDTAMAPLVRISDDSRLMISNFGNFSMDDASFDAAVVMVLSFRSITRRFRFWTNAWDKASIPGARMPFCGIRMTSNVPMIWRPRECFDLEQHQSRLTSNALAKARAPSFSSRLRPAMNCFNANRFPPAARLFLWQAINASANN